MFDVTTVGHFSIDYINLPERHVVRPTLGGPPTYVSLAAAKLGAKVSVISKVGEDFPPSYVAWLKNQGIDLSGLQKVKDASTTSYALNYKKDGERQLILRKRAPVIKAEDIPNYLKSKAVHIAPIANEILPEVIKKVQGQAGIVSLDPQGFLRRFKEDGSMFLGQMKDLEVLRWINMFKASREEIRKVTGESNLGQAVKKVHKHGVETVIVTKGAEGSLLYVKGTLYQVPAAKPRIIVDTTGSGDVFIGGLLAEYIKGKDLLWCASVGSASASFVVEKLGPRGFGSAKELYERATVVYERSAVLIF